MSQPIEDLLREERTFPPSREFASSANAAADIYDRAAADPISYWESEARRLTWMHPWRLALDDSNAPFFQWFVGGRLNVTESCLDRHARAAGDRVAFHWEGEPGDTQTISYRELLVRVCRFANALRGLGVGKGDTVAIYLGMVPELPIAMLACARLGAAHSVVFGGFSSDALADRMNDARCRVVITADGAWRRGAIVALKDNVDQALERTPTVEHQVVVRRTRNAVAWRPGRDHWLHDLVATAADECPPEPMDAEDRLFILYTSGSTGRPKGIAHSTGGYLTGVASTHRLVFDIKPSDVFWCTADCGWITGHSYVVYGPLANGCTSVIYEGSPDYPDKDRFWALIAKYGVSVFYTAPTAIRTFMKWGPEYLARHDLSSLRLLGTVGEPINPEAWMWYHEHVGRARCPIVDTWWQTETGCILISPLPGIVPTKPGSATRPMPGIEVDVVDDQGHSVPPGGGGYLVIKRPWPSMLRTIHADPARYESVYWSRFPGLYFAGDGCKRDADGYYWLLGRVDDVMLVSGHNISTTEVESALVDHPAVAEAAVVGRADPRTGQAIAAFVTLKGHVRGDESLIQELRNHVAKKIGAIAKPASIVLTEDLPKTRSGKIMRRLLRDISEARQLGDVTTLANAAVVEEIRTHLGAGPTDES
ncbi:MAG: acetate--CoA ligase [Planctomycetota bacterium]